MGITITHMIRMWSRLRGRLASSPGTQDIPVTPGSIADWEQMAPRDSVSARNSRESGVSLFVLFRTSQEYIPCGKLMTAVDRHPCPRGGHPDKENHIKALPCRDHDPLEKLQEPEPEPWEDDLSIASLFVFFCSSNPKSVMIG